MTTYVMEAKENLSADLIAVIDNEIDTVTLTSDIEVSPYQPGISYDRVRRQIVYSVCYVPDNSVLVVPNDTGHRLWSGVHGINSAANYSPYAYRNFSIMTLELDTGDVTRYDCWDTNSLVPNGIGGSDGTARRFVESDSSTPQVIKLVDPRTGDVWSHHVSSPTSVPFLSCFIYCFRRSESYKQTISPLVPDTDRHLELFGINTDWVYIGDYQKLTAGRYTLLLTPRLRTAEEVSQDYLLSYAEFDFPAASTSVFRTALDTVGSLYLLCSKVTTGVRHYTVQKFTQPTSAPYGGPTVGGGFTDVTPWVSGAGPDADAIGYGGSVGSFNAVILEYLPATHELVCLIKLYPGDKTVPTNNPADFSVSCTYVDLDAGTYDHHAAFITGYMTAAWVPTANPLLASWAIQDFREVDADLSYHSYTFPGHDYTKRRFYFWVRPVVGGVVTGYSGAVPDSGTHVIMAEYSFVSGSAPALSRVYDEQGWDDAYPAYGTAIGDPNVVIASMQSILTLGLALYDTGIWDGETNAWWWSGQNQDFWRFDADFTPRLDYMGEPPFLRISFGSENPTGKGYVRVRYGDQS